MSELKHNMLATTRQRILHIDNNDLDVHTGDYKIVQSDCIDYLGVKIDETISWNKQTYLCNEITLHSEIAERTTRSVNDNNVFVPYAHLESFKNPFTHRGPIVWNSLPDYIKTCRTLHSFKVKMKLFI